MKKALALMTASAMALSLAACGGSSSTASSTASSASSAAESVVESAAAAAGTSVTKDNIKFGFLAPTLQTEFFIGIDDGLKQVAAEDGWDYTSVSFENDSGTAVTDIENMVTSGCNVILAMVSDSSCDDALRAAQEAGTIVIECGVVTDVYDVSVNSSQYDIGTMISDMAGEWINTQLDGKETSWFTPPTKTRICRTVVRAFRTASRSFAPIPTFLRSWISARTLWAPVPPTPKR